MAHRKSLPHLNLLTATERSLVEGTTSARLRDLTEDELLVTLEKVRRLRDKYSMLYRRQAAAKVPKAGGRGKAAESNQLTAVKAEVFEDALGRISAQLSRVAREESARLKAERLKAARAGRSGHATPKRTASESKVGEGAKNTRVKRGPTPLQKKIGAVSRSNQRRAQARKQSRNG
jgi:hypothetical protein